MIIHIMINIDSQNFELNYALLRVKSKSHLLVTTAYTKIVCLCMQNSNQNSLACLFMKYMYVYELELVGSYLLHSLFMLFFVFIIVLQMLYEDPVTSIDIEKQTLTTNSGKLLKYGSLIIATGCTASRYFQHLNIAKCPTCLCT